MTPPVMPPVVVLSGALVAFWGSDVLSAAQRFGQENGNVGRDESGLDKSVGRIFNGSTAPNGVLSPS